MSNQAEEIWVEGLAKPIKVRRNARARRVTLTVNHATQDATITGPPRVAHGQLIAFAEKNSQWVAKKLAALPQQEPFVFGMELPYRGYARKVEAAARTGISADGWVLGVRATRESLPGVLEGWLRAKARERFAECSRLHAQTLGVEFSAISIRDTRSRWGSCSSNGALSYSWRAIMAPDGALNYLAAHEVSHLKEMNHSPRFWAHVEALCPDYLDWKGWFSQYGAELHRYGRDG